MQTIIAVILSACAAIVLIPIFDEYFYRRKASRMGCGKIAVAYKHPLGLTEVMNQLISLSRNTFLSDLQDSFERNESVQTTREVLMGKKWLVTYDPVNVKSILALNFKDYSLGYRYNAFFPMLGNGIFTLSGEGWRHSRALLRPQFARDQVGHIQTIKSHVNILIDQFRTRTAQGETVDAQELFHRLTIDTASEFLFGTSCDTLLPNSPGVVGPRGLVTGEMFAKAFSQSLYKMSVRLLFGPLFWLYDSFTLRRDIATCHNLIDYYVEKALEAPMEKNDEAERYIFIKELTKETRDPRVIRDQAFNVLLAGRDTTASLLSYCTFYLGKHKDIYAQLREAVISEFGYSDEELSFETLKRCKFLQYVLNEVLRLHPIVPTNFRTAIRDTCLPRGAGPDGNEPVLVPKGTSVFYVPYVMQRSKLYWGEDANDFRPDRWTEHRDSSHAWDYLPFNGGPRICLGQQFALTEAGLVLVRMAQSFKDIEIISPNPATTTPRNMAQWMRLTSSVAGGVHARFVQADED